MRTATLLSLVLALVPPAAGSAQGDERAEAPPVVLGPPLPDPGEGAPLLDHGALTAALEELAAASELVELEVYGRSGEGRALHVLRLAEGPVEPGRPALLVVANVDGPLVYTSGMVLQHARDLVRLHGEGDEEVRSLLAKTTLYLVPRANPDGAEARFERPLGERWGTGLGVDDDRDGRTGEDGPADVDGDGLVAHLRVVPREPGRRDLVADPVDGRALREARPERGERGSWQLVPEGRDVDGDGRVAEDAARDARVNRNFALDFEEHTARAGLYPGHEPETRALYDLVLAHPEIQLCLTYGLEDNLVETPKGIDDDARERMRVPPSGLRASDALLVAELGRRYREASTNRTKGEGDPAGTFQHWVYGHRGLLSLAVRPWSIPLDTPAAQADAEPAPGPGSDGAQEAGAQEAEPAGAEDEPAPKAPPAPEPSDDALRLRWIDAGGEAEAWRHLGWRPIELEPFLLAEVGGFAPYARIEPPAARRAELAREHLAFLKGLAPVPARVRLGAVGVTGLGGGLHRVEATLVNDGLLPLLTRSGELTRTTRPARVRLELPRGAELLAGNALRLVEDVPGLGWSEPLTWLVRTDDPDALRLVLESDHAGHDEHPQR